MRLIIDLVLVFILVICIWQGYRRGIIRSVLGLSAIIIALILSNVLATNISKHIVPALEPFAGGYIDSEATTSKVLANLGYGDSDKSLDDILAEDSSLRYDYAYECLRETGFFAEVSEDLAQDSVSYAERNNISMTNAVITVVCNSAAYVLCETVMFIMIIILLAGLMDLFNMNIRLPGAPEIDSLAGAGIGFLEGFIICVLLAWMLGFGGLIIGKNMSDKGLLNFFLAFRFITRTLI